MLTHTASKGGYAPPYSQCRIRTHENTLLQASVNKASICGTLHVPQERYNNGAMVLSRTHLTVLAVLVTVFVALYPYLGTMEMCDAGECPYAAQSSSHTSSAGLASVCVSAVLSAFPAMLAFALLRGRCLTADLSLPMQLYLSPDPPPPRTLLS